jgi:formylglycine-generating enzyme required for sulfatase activity
MLPVTGIAFREAADYCEGVAGRLPTEAEWERAARGGDRRRFPWGRYYNERLANHGSATGRSDPSDGALHSAPVGSYVDGQSPYGVRDLAGNVWEWTSDRFAADAYVSLTSRVDPTGPDTGGERVVRGGSWRSPPFTLRAANRAPMPEGDWAPDLGFRCAYDPVP